MYIFFTVLAIISWGATFSIIYVSFFYKPPKDIISSMPFILPNLCLLYVSFYLSCSAIAEYDFQYNFDRVVGKTLKLTKGIRNSPRVEYFYMHAEKGYINEGYKSHDHIICPNGKYEVKVSKTLPSWSKMDFNKPLNEKVINVLIPPSY